MLDRYDLYELCVQTPEDLAPLLAAIHGGDPMVLGEDFCGTAALSACWVGAASGRRAVVVDHDAEPLARVTRQESIEIVRGDVIRDTSPDRHRVDVLYTGNFSIGEMHTRRELLDYLRHARARLGTGGIFVCDTYGGETSFQTGSVERDHPLPDGRIVRYAWEQREADQLTGEVVDVMHFRVLRNGVVEQDLPDAFVYRWRLRSVPELRDAMRDAGFVSTDVYPRVPDARDDDGVLHVLPIRGPSELDDSFDVLVVGR